MKFGTKILPLVLHIQERDRKNYVERLVPGKAFAHRKIHGGFGEEYLIRGLITEDLAAEKAALKALADGTARILDLEDGTPQLYAIMVDPVFERSENPTQIPYELLFAQTSMFESRMLSDTVGITDVLTGFLTAFRSLSESPSISEARKAFKKGPNFGFSTVGSQNYPTETVDSYAESNRDDYQSMRSGATTSVAQAIPAKSYPFQITSVKFYMDKVGAPTGNAYAKIYACTGTPGTNGKPTGSPLGTSNPVDVTTLLVGTWTLKEFTFPTPIADIASGSFCVAVEYSGGDASNYVRAGLDGSSPTHAGNYAYYISPNWTANSSYDVIFYVIGRRLKGYAKRAVKFNLASQTAVQSVRIYSHVAVGNARVAIFDEASPKAKKWESGSVALVVGFNEILISSGNPTSLTLNPADYGLWWQYDNVADAPSFAQGVSGDGCYIAQAYGAFPTTISGETLTSEKWTEDGTQTWIEI